MGRDLKWEACWNVRELGGYATNSGALTKYGRIVRAGNLSRLTTAGKDALVAYGVRTVIDLRDPQEFAVELDPFHERGHWAGAVRYLNVPLISDEEWTAVKDPVRRKRGYVLTVELSRINVGRVMSAIANAQAGVVVHCHAGKERTGVVSALLLELAGVADDGIGDDFVESDRHLQALYEVWSQREEDPEKRAQFRESFSSEARHILAPLEYVRAHGGIEAYLMDAGLSREALQRLRVRLLE